MTGEVLPPAGAGLGELLAPLDDDRLHWPDFERLCTNHAQLGWRMGVVGFVIVGRALAAYRKRAGDGQWGGWLAQTLPISRQTAARLMRIGLDPNIGRYLDGVNIVNTPLPNDQLILDEIAGLEPEAFDELVDHGVIHPEMKRGAVKRRLIERRHDTGGGDTREFPVGKWPVILADPPWRFESWSDAGKDRSAENHYPTMALDDIKALGPQVKACAADDAVLLMWTTSDQLENALDVLKRWGFKYSTTGLVWIKGGAPAKGYWTRKGVEICLLGTRGSPSRIDAGVDERIFAPRGKHSEKPQEVYESVESLVAGPYLELFGRKPRPGWTVWGNDPALWGKEEEAE